MSKNTLTAGISLFPFKRCIHLPEDDICHAFSRVFQLASWTDPFKVDLLLVVLSELVPLTFALRGFLLRKGFWHGYMQGDDHSLWDAVDKTKLNRFGSI